MKHAMEKMGSLELKIEALCAEQQKIEQSVTNEIMALLKSQKGFSVDFDTLIGGILHVLSSIHSKSGDVGGWQQAGQKFRQRHKTRKRSSHKTTASVV